MPSRRHHQLLGLIYSAFLVIATQACGNNRATQVAVRINSVRKVLTCAQVIKRTHCGLVDLRTNKLVKEICRDQCLARCVVPPTPAPTNPFVLNTVPSGPYITKTSNSKVITLPNPPSPTLIQGASRTNCPHLKSGLKSWHVATTWPTGVIPSAGSDVTLPAFSKVVIQQSVAQKLGVINVPISSELIIGENAAGITLLAKGMNVKGNLTIGSETCRIEKPVTITLWGSRASNVVQAVPSPTYKGILVTGTLNVHGKRFYATWSRLAKTIQAGETVLLLQQPVNWERGQKVVLTTSIMYDSRAYHQNEVVTVYQVADAANTPSGVGAVVHLWQPVKYKHVANQYYQVEAGLLSRTIVIQGSATDSEPTDKDPLTSRATKFQSWQFLYNMPMPNTNRSKTGYGGHVMVTGAGKMHVEGVELYRMGQTNVLGRYPMHMHLLGNCPTCYFKDSSIHHSFYRCISVHGTNQSTVSENVAYDVTGFCYYLEDGVEHDNTISYNLAAHIHTLGPELTSASWEQTLSDYDESAVAGKELTLPADVTASGFYITNVHNNIIGNAASGGWSGFAFPVLARPIGDHANVKMRPRSASGLTIEGNTAHSTGFWWEHAGAFYFGGSLYTKADGTLRYNPGRGNFGRDARQTCAVYNDCVRDDCWCDEENQLSLNMTNTKTFLTAGVGLNSWTGQMNVKGFEAYDQRLAVEALSEGFWIDKMYVACRTGEALGLPSPGTAARLEGSFFYFYDTGQSHILTNAVVKNCGYRSDAYNQYDTSPTRGCGTESDASKGCSDSSTVFGLLTHSDQFVPEVMQGTKAITFFDCGRRFKFTMDRADTVSGRCQNWIDSDGTISGLNEPTIIGSGLGNASGWWEVEDDVVKDVQGPLTFIKQNNGPGRGVAHVHFSWNPTLHDKTGSEYCFNGGGGPCPTLGYVRHLGRKFSPTQSLASKGLPITVNPDTVGPVGGYGWVLKLNGGAPRDLTITQIEIDPSDVLLLSIAYPVGTVFNISANAEPWCWPNWDGKAACHEYMKAVSSVDLVRNGAGNTYHVDSQGVLTLRIFQVARTWTGNPTWFGIPSLNMIARDGVNFAVPRFERAGIILPNSSEGYFRIQAKCGGTGVFCTGTVADYDPDVCPSGYEQVAYDKCCSTTVPSQCKFADGSTTNRRLNSPN